MAASNTTPPHGGPADGDVTKIIEDEANALLEEDLRGIKRVHLAQARAANCVRSYDFVTPYVAGLGEIVDLEAIAAAKLKIGVDPMGGSGLAYWGPLAERSGIDFDVVNKWADPTFGFMTVDKDGKIQNGL